MPQFQRSLDNDWTPKTDSDATKNEIFSSPDDASGEGFALALAAKLGTKRPWLWVQDQKSRLRSGIPLLHGLPQSLRYGCHYISADKPEDALFVMEEGLRCSALGFVIGELAGDPNALGFTQSRRLAVASEQYGVPLYLLRNGATRQLSAARMRWDITPIPSASPATNLKAPGDPAWEVELFRSRQFRPSSWKLGLRHDGLSIIKAENNLDMAALFGN